MAKFLSYSEKDIDNHYLYIDLKILSVTYLKIVTRKLKIGDASLKPLEKEIKGRRKVVKMLNLKKITK